MTSFPSPSRLVATACAFVLITACSAPSPAGAQTALVEREADAPRGVFLGAGFGGVAALGDGEAFVGSAPVGWQTGDEPPGTVYRFVRSASGDWRETSGVMASDGQIGDDFGRSVVFGRIGDRDVLVVGAPGVGAAYVFEKSDGGWRETGKLTPSALADGVEFGGAYARAGSRTQNIAIAGDRIAVTAFGSEPENNGVHVFARMNGTWQEEAVLTQGSDAQPGFAYAVAGTNNTVFVSANQADERRGAVYVYTRAADGWYPAGTVAINSALDTRASLGQTLAFDAATSTMYAGAPYHDGLGAVFVFKNDGQGAWVESGQLVLPQAQDDERPTIGLGNSLAVHGGRVVAGARGAAIVFDATGTPSRLDPSDDRARAGFGSGLAMHGDALLVGSPAADYEEGVTTVFEFHDGTGDNAAGWYATATLASEVSYLTSIYGDQVDCEDGSASMFGCDNVDMVSFMSASELRSERGVKMTDIWGWEDPETGKEWVVLGRTDGTAFVDISDPANPVYVGQLYRTDGSPGSAWRDVKVYRNHAFVVADGADQHGVQIFDMTQLRDVDPADMPVTFKETAHYDGTASTHNIVINEETGFAYAVGNRSGGNNPCGGQLHIFDVRDPANPQFAGCFSSGQGGTHDAQCVIYRGADSDYTGREICFASNGSSFVIGDVTDKDSTFTVANTSYPNQAYTHQGWLTEDHNYFFMNDELDEMNGSVDRTRTLIWDVTDLDDPQLVKEYYLSSGASDHNLYIRDNLMYQSNYQAGLRIIDVADPLNPVEVGHFDTAPYAEDAAGFGGSWSNYPYFKSGVIAVSSRSEGLFILKKRPVDM